ncbi:hypothetical protein M9H77_23675 [Catharanthus roseus]|uniref:Uncharacterized protein n=1 Tax=Catharanthus roseus TaxID=4058 RepID=A0ACC0AWH8_CATRO|nr:hypothetical protein M9H77_23675 [Catharanthus roseus]
MNQPDREQYNWSRLWTREQLKPRRSPTLPTAFALRHSVVIKFYSLSASFRHIREETGTWREAILALSVQVQLTKEEGWNLIGVEGGGFQKGGCGPLLTLDTPTLGQTLEDSPINMSYCPLILDALISRERLIYCNKLGVVYPISFAFIRPDLDRPHGPQRNLGNHSPLC